MVHGREMTYVLDALRSDLRDADGTLLSVLLLLQTKMSRFAETHHGVKCEHVCMLPQMSL